MINTTPTAIAVGDLVKVLGDPPAIGEVVACAPSVQKVRVRFRNGAYWLHIAHVELFASGGEE